ncbi:MAG: Mn2+/Fe2+ NRAMP family transporter [Rhodothermales bacterium]
MTDEELIDQAEAAGGVSKWAKYLKMCGPGFLQSACTIGGGTLASCLFMGSIAGLSGLWIQPIAIVLGVIVLGLIAHVTLANDENPFHLINRTASPVLGWGWLIATVAANMIWVLPQYNLAVGALTKNVAPGLLGGDNGKAIATIGVAVVATAIIMLQLRGGKSARIFDRVIQVTIALIVLCFGAVVFKLLSNGDLSIGAMLSGLVPKPSLMSEPASTYTDLLAACGETKAYWSAQITSTQKNVIFAAIGASVGINMTFLLPYTLRDRKWGKKHMSLSKIDLSVGLVIPFVLVTVFVISAASTTLHTKVDASLTGWSFASPSETEPGQLGKYRDSLSKLAVELNGEAFPKKPKDFEKLEKEAQEEILVAQNPYLDKISVADRAIASATLKHGTAALAAPLKELFGGSAGTLIFGIGVVFIALSTILMLMLINGYALEAAFGLPRYVGCLLVLDGVLGPFIWGKTGAYLAVPTSVIGLTLLPIAIWAFFFVAKSKKMGEHRLGGLGTVVCAVVALIYTYLSGWAAYGKIGMLGPGIMIAIAIAALLTSPLVRKTPDTATDSASSSADAE